MIQEAQLSPEEIKALYALPPSLKGIIVTLIIQASFANTFSIFETLLTPILTDQNHLFTENLTLSRNYAASVFITMCIFALLGFFSFRKFYERQRLNKLSDRAFVFSSLVIGFVGSMILIDYKKRFLYQYQVMAGFCMLSVAFFIGRRVTSNMYAKLIGISSTNDGAKYHFISTLFLFSARFGAAFWNVQSAHTGLYLV